MERKRPTVFTIETKLRIETNDRESSERMTFMYEEEEIVKEKVTRYPPLKFNITRCSNLAQNSDEPVLLETRMQFCTRVFSLFRRKIHVDHPVMSSSTERAYPLKIDKSDILPC